jgi:hypothetical protein
VAAAVTIVMNDGPCYSVSYRVRSRIMAVATLCSSL